MHDTIIRLADVWKTCNKIRAAAFRVGLNLWDWYRPLDPDGNSLISESKFVSVLAGALRSVIGLSDAEIAQLADYFRAQDGRVLYHQLCQVIHGEDARDREKPSSSCVLDAAPQEAPRPRLDQWQARRLCCLLATIAQRDIPFRPYFQDYELVAKIDGRITFAHFARILNFVGVIVSEEDFNLLVRRYIKDSYTLDYVEFLKDIDAVKKQGVDGLGPEYQHPKALIDTRAGQRGLRPAAAAVVPAGSLQRQQPPRSIVELMLRVQEYVFQRRVRVSEFFRDYDLLNSGRVSVQQFLRALDMAGVGGVLSAREARCVAAHYTHPQGEGVCWRRFEDDCDQVFTIKELEKHPTLTPGVPPPPASSLPLKGALNATEEQTRTGACTVVGEGGDAAAGAVLRVRALCRERSVDLRPLFGEHDHHRNGHVPPPVLSRVLSRGGVLLSPAAVQALKDRYLDDLGVNYYMLLDDLEERAVEPAAVSSAAPATARPFAAHHDPRQTDIVQILAKVKGKMCREGIRPQQFLHQYDDGRGLISRSQFHRALSAACLPLTPKEMDTLMEVFSAPGQRQFIQYQRFEEVVSGGAGGVERAPLLVPVPHVPPPAPPAPHLQHEERALVSVALDLLAKHPDRVAALYDVFRETDKSNRGRVPQFIAERALCRAGMLELLSSRQRDAVCRAFGVATDGGDELQYRALCNSLNVIHAAARAQPC